ncbi:lipopolysaccharide biosynthesis protein [Citreicella sp. C3M06]|uniref:GumC family protein n=1 Tax=Citreicella sp. C3M06 TaxID=2841564 RepID=UPI001C0981BC|nr:Wzz/FepE/Etk N-terminal domain-containing protein [Citreicella sp. C3M06]MBU2960048.1 lipopolysaccharide biosynthesis protein [Citreicella sp. C3M06]
MDLSFYLRRFVRRLHWLVLFVLLGASLGLYFAITLPPVYGSSARLIVEAEQIPDDLAASTVRTSAGEQISIIEQRILTREVLLELANRMAIYTGEDAQLPASAKVADLRDRISIELTGGGRNALLVNVRFRDSDAQRVARVTNEIVTLILSENVRMRTTVSGQTLEFFTQEVDRLEQEISSLSARMLSFQEQNLDALPDSLDFRRSQQAGLQERLIQLGRDEQSLEERRTRLVELFENTGRVPDVEVSGALSADMQQLMQLRRDYASARVVLAETNPRLELMQARIAALEKTVAEQQAAADRLSENAPEGSAAPSAFEIQLADIESQLADIQSRRQELRSRMEELADSIARTPGNSVTLDAMQRDYDNLQAQYNRAVSNQSRAETGDMIEALSKGQRISLVEPAIAPRNPMSPNRKVLAAGGVAGGLLLGMGLIAVIELLNSTVRRPSEITAKLGIEALATVPYIHTADQLRNQRKRRKLLVGAVLAGVLLLGGGLWLVDSQIMPLGEAVEMAIARARNALGAPQS